MPINQRQKDKRNEKLAKLSMDRFLENLEDYDMSYSDLCDITITVSASIIRAHSCKECPDCGNSLENNIKKIISTITN